MLSVYNGIKMYEENRKYNVVGVEFDSIAAACDAIYSFWIDADLCKDVLSERVIRNENGSISSIQYYPKGMEGYLDRFAPIIEIIPFKEIRWNKYTCVPSKSRTKIKAMG